MFKHIIDKTNNSKPNESLCQISYFLKFNKREFVFRQLDIRFFAFL